MKMFVLYLCAFGAVCLAGFIAGWLAAVPPTLNLNLRQTPVTNSLVHVLILTQPSDIGTKQAK